MASQNFVIICSGNGLVPIWHQAITWNHDDLSSIVFFLKTIKSSKYWNWNIFQMASKSGQFYPGANNLMVEIQ